MTKKQQRRIAKILAVYTLLNVFVGPVFWALMSSLWWSFYPNVLFDSPQEADNYARFLAIGSGIVSSLVGMGFFIESIQGRNDEPELR